MLLSYWHITPLMTYLPTLRTYRHNRPLMTSYLPTQQALDDILLTDTTDHWCHLPYRHNRPLMTHTYWHNISLTTMCVPTQPTLDDLLFAEAVDPGWLFTYRQKRPLATYHLLTQETINDILFANTTNPSWLLNLTYRHNRSLKTSYWLTWDPW